MLNDTDLDAFDSRLPMACHTSHQLSPTYYFPWRVDNCNSANKNCTEIVLTQQSPLGKPGYLAMDASDTISGCDNLESRTDRYIPRRQETCIRGLAAADKASDDSDMERTCSQMSTPYLRKQAFSKILKAQFMPLDPRDTSSSISVRKAKNKLLKFGCESSQPLRKRLVLRSLSKITSKPAAILEIKRMYETAPYKTEDAVDLPDNFYMSVIDWSSKNFVATPLGLNVRLWNQSREETSLLIPRYENEDFGGITALKFSPLGDLLALGNNNGICRVVCSQTGKETFSVYNHISRLGVCTWIDDMTLVCGSAQGLVSIHDIRSPNEDVILLQKNQSIVCGMSYSPFLKRLAVGCNNNLVSIWDIRKDKPELELFNQKTAVRAVEWNPHERGQLYTGGGCKDKRLRIYNGLTGLLTKTIRLDSQITGIIFSRSSREFVTTHGYVENDIRLWNCDNIQQPLARFEGHKGRVIYSAASPSGTDIVTGSSDNTIKFWHVFYGSTDNSWSSLSHNYKELR